MYTNICKHCHKVFKARLKRACCGDCTETDELLFDRIMEYLKQYPNSSALQIAKGLDIEAAQVTGYMEDGRLSVSPGRLSMLD